MSISLRRPLERGICFGHEPPRFVALPIRPHEPRSLAASRRRRRRTLEQFYRCIRTPPADKPADRPRAIDGSSGTKKSQANRNDQSATEAFWAYATAHVLCSGAVVLDCHEQAGTAP